MSRRAWLGAGAAFALDACRKHLPVESEPELGYPLCPDGGAPEADGGALDEGRLAAEGHIRSGPWSQEKNVVERFELRQSACGYTFRSRQEWVLAVSDVEVRYDPSFAPLWAWKRMTIPASTRPDGHAEIRRYELRTGDVFIKKRTADGQVTRERLLPGGRRSADPSARVGAVIGPGRGVLTPWLWRAKLNPRSQARELVLDFRAPVETLEIATLERGDDESEPPIGRVRVYTFFGRETVFADDHDVVVGDLAGMRSSAALSTPEPPPLPSFGGPNPAAPF